MVYKYFYSKHEGGFIRPIYLPTHPKTLAKQLPKRVVIYTHDDNTGSSISPRVQLRPGLLALAVFFQDGRIWDAIIYQEDPETEGWRRYSRPFKELEQYAKGNSQG